jgi:Tol biopolymer transport system component
MGPLDQPTRRLESWKEIATYLGKGVTTVQRWEKSEGLPVHRQVHQSLASVFAYTHELDTWRDGRKAEPVPTAVEESVLKPPPGEPMGLSRRAWVGGSILAAAGLGMAALVRPRLKEATARPLFHGSLNESAPSITRDGRYIFYRERDTTAIRFRLFDLRTRANRVLETHPLEMRSAVPRISPDGAMIAFLTLGEGNLWKVHVRDRESGPARQIAELDGVGVAWAPDSQTLAMTSRPAEGGPVAVFAVHQLHGNWRRVTNPPGKSWGDIDVAASPDGMHLAVIRYATHGDGDVWLLSWDGRVERRLTQLRTWINGLTFTADGSEIVFCPVVGHQGRLYRVSIAGGEPREIPAPGTRGAAMPSACAGALVFEDRGYVSRLYRGRVESGSVVDDRPLTAVTAGGEYAAHSLDGNGVAWTQTDGIWAAAPGAAPRRIVAHRPEKRNVAWSADGRHLAMVARDGGHWRIYVIEVASGRINRLTKDDAAEGRPAWSPSGKHIYWRSERSGEPHYYRRRWPDGSGAEEVSPMATEGIPAADDLSFYYTNDEQRSRIHEVAASGAAPRVLDHIPPVKPGHWFVRGVDIVYAPTHESGPTTPILRAPIAGGTARLVCRLPVHGDGLANLTVSRDLDEIVWSRLESADDVWIIEGFR